MIASNQIKRWPWIYPSQHYRLDIQHKNSAFQIELLRHVFFFEETNSQIWLFLEKSMKYKHFCWNKSESLWNDCVFMLCNCLFREHWATELRVAVALCQSISLNGPMHYTEYIYVCVKFWTFYFNCYARVRDRRLFLYEFLKGVCEKTWQTVLYRKRRSDFVPLRHEVTGNIT